MGKRDPEGRAVASLSVDAGGNECAKVGTKDVEDKDDEANGLAAIDLGGSAAWHLFFVNFSLYFCQSSLLDRIFKVTFLNSRLKQTAKHLLLFGS